MRPYIAFFQGKRLELLAFSLYDAVKQARVQLRVPASKYSLLSVVLADVPVDPASL